MNKPTGAICNLDCEYCFFLSKEMLYPGSRFRMAEQLLPPSLPCCSLRLLTRRGMNFWR